MGIPSVNADQLCHELYSSPALLARMAERWGEKILAPDGTLNRAALADIVFPCQAELDALAGMVLPLAEKETEVRLAQLEQDGHALALLDAPLLYEAGWDRLTDAVIAVWAPDELRMRRLEQDRGWDRQEILRRQEKQISAAEKLERAGYGLINSGDRAFLEQQCAVLLEKIMDDWKITENYNKTK